MSLENPVTPDKLREQVRKAIAAPQWLNRQDRRSFERAQRRGQKNVPSLPSDMGISEVHQLQSIDSLLGEEDIFICAGELKEYESAEAAGKLSFDLLRILRTVNIPDASIRAYYGAWVKGDIPQGGFTDLLFQANPIKLKQQKGSFIKYEARRVKLLRDHNGKVVFDEDAIQIFSDLIKIEDIPIEEIFKEISRSRTDRMELLKMQIEWLQTPESVEGVSDQEVKVEEEQSTDEVEPESIVRPLFSLSDWDLYWTTNHWSQDPNHLISIPTTSREEALECFTGISRGEISVKPGSILKALEFHLQKSVIQRALATRNKYGPEGIRDWVKIKRGRDRIFFNVSEEESRAVFFAAGRDDVYKDI